MNERNKDIEAEEKSIKYKKAHNSVITKSINISINRIKFIKYKDVYFDGFVACKQFTKHEHSSI